MPVASNTTLNYAQNSEVTKLQHEKPRALESGQQRGTKKLNHQFQNMQKRSETAIGVLQHPEYLFSRAILLFVFSTLSRSVSKVSGPDACVWKVNEAVRPGKVLRICIICFDQFVGSAMEPRTSRFPVCL